MKTIFLLTIFLTFFTRADEIISIKELKDIPWPNDKSEPGDLRADPQCQKRLHGAKIGALIINARDAAYDVEGNCIFKWSLMENPSPEILFATRMYQRITHSLGCTRQDLAQVIRKGDVIVVLDPTDKQEQPKPTKFYLSEYYRGNYGVQIKAYGQQPLGPFGSGGRPLLDLDPYWPTPIPRPSNEEMEKICAAILDIASGKVEPKRDLEELARREALYNKRAKEYREEREQHLPMRATQEWDKRQAQEPRQFTRIFWDNANYGKGIEQHLKLDPLPERNTIPNVNTGVGCEPFLAELIQKGFQLTARKGGNYLMTATLKDKKTSVRYCIYHAFNPTEARQTLFAWNMYADERGTPRIVEKPGDFTMQAAIDNMNVRPGWVGDFDLCTKPRFNWEGALVEGSEKSAVYFMRGNTAAYFIADNPSYDVRPLARMLDEQLQDGLKRSESKHSSGEKGKQD